MSSQQPIPPPPPPPPGGLAGLVSQLFGYIDKPWKAVTVAVLFIIGGMGWVLYEKRNEIFESWLTPSTVELKIAEVPEALGKLISETGADLVQIWAVDLSSNSQWFIGARRADGERPVIPAPRRLPIIVASSDVRALIDVLEGTPTCKEVLTSGSPLARRLADRGMKRGCAIPIPPNPQFFVGVIYLSWVTPTDLSAENVAVGAAREIAMKLSNQ